MFVRLDVVVLLLSYPELTKSNVEVDFPGW